MSKCDGLVIIVVVIAENVAIKGKQLRRRKRSNNSDSSDSGVKVIATSVRCADWLAFLARYRPLHLERPHQTRRLVPTQTRSRARAFTARLPFISFFMLRRLDCSRSIGLITRRALPPRHSTFHSFLEGETMDCLCARLALCFDDDTRPMICRSDLPFDGYNKRENNGHVLRCSSSCLSFQWFLSGHVACGSVRLPSDIANNSNNLLRSTAPMLSIPMLALCEDVSVPF